MIGGPTPLLLLESTMELWGRPSRPILLVESLSRNILLGVLDR
jgi:hypothetical protein